MSSVSLCSVAVVVDGHPVIAGQGEADREDLQRDLGTYAVRSKDALGVIFAKIQPCPSPCRNHEPRKEALAKKARGEEVKEVPHDCGGGQLHRLNANVVHVSCLALDLDRLSPEQYKALVAGVRGSGLESYFWETFSHSPEAPKVRVVFPLVEPVPGSQWKPIRAALIERIRPVIGNVVVDAQTCNAARIFYLASRPSAEAVRESFYTEGVRLDWRGLTPTAPARTATPLDAPALGSLPADHAKVRADLLARGTHFGQQHVINLAGGVALTPPPSRRVGAEASAPSRYEAWLSATNALAACWEGATFAELLAFVQPSWEAECAEAVGSDGPPTESGTVERHLDSARQRWIDEHAKGRAREEEKARLFGVRKAKPSTSVPTTPSPRRSLPMLDVVDPKEIRRVKKRARTYAAGCGPELEEAIVGVVFYGRPPLDPALWPKVLRILGKLACRWPPTAVVEILAGKALQRGRMEQLNSEQKEERR